MPAMPRGEARHEGVLGAGFSCRAVRAAVLSVPREVVVTVRKEGLTLDQLAAVETILYGKPKRQKKAEAARGA